MEMKKRIIETPDLLFREGEHVWNEKKPDCKIMQILKAEITENNIRYTVAPVDNDKNPWGDSDSWEYWDEKDIERVENGIPRFHIGEFICKKSNPALIAQVRRIVISESWVTYDVDDKSPYVGDSWDEEDVESAEDRLRTLFKEEREE